LLNAEQAVTIAYEQFGSRKNKSSINHVPDKCQYTVISCKWENNEWKTMSQINSKVQVQIKDDDGITHAVEQIRSDHGELALGVKFSPVNNNQDEANHLWEKSRKWAELVRTGHLKRYEAWVGLETTIMNTINYAMPATTLSKKKLDDIMKPILEVWLPKSGICREMARAVDFAPRKFFGLGL
jgi:hypothetical protein